MVTVYDAVTRATWRQMIVDLSRTRTLVWYLFGRDVRAQYKQSALGYVAAIAPPLVTAAIFTFVARARVLPIAGTDLPYPVFVLLGLIVWGVFAGVVTHGTASLAAAAGLVQKMNFPREAIVVASAGQSVIEMLVRCVPLLLLILWLGAKVSWAILLAPLVIVPLVTLAIGLAFVLSVMNAVARDVATTATLALQIGLFLTPVVYPRPVSWPFVLINYLNPVAPFVSAVHDLAAVGTVTDPRTLLAATAFAALTFLAGWRVFRLAQPVVIERL